MKIVFLDSLTFGSAFDFSPLERFGNLVLYSHSDPQEVGARIGDAQIVITNKVPINSETLKGAKSLRLICVAATGVNNVDLQAAQEMGVIVSNVSGYASKSVAQHTLAAALYLLHSLPYHHHYSTGGEWSQAKIFTHMERPFEELEELSWGILGMGAIGKETARLVSVFGSRILYCSMSGKDRADYQRVEFRQLLEESDILSIHAPLSDSTKNLIGEKELKLLGSNSIIINVGRGGIIDEQALLKALEKNWIQGAALDVLEKEPPDSENPLFQFHDSARLLITPHNSWAGSRGRLLMELCENIDFFLRGMARNVL